MDSSQKVIIGRLGAAYGIKGWLHLISFTDPISNIFSYKNWQLKKNGQTLPIRLEAHKAHGKGYVIKIRDINDRELAAQHKGLEITIDRSELPQPKNEEYYWSDLVGLSVSTTTGESLGVIDYLFETGANDVIVTKGDKQHFIPYIDGVIISVDLSTNNMTVEWEPI